ncbi:MAG TPA: SH3 domain-containing protein, partial [Rhizomicrobium sp.]|nr:SH3 domain-containing protein [Rhizomicrobium sp.]
GYTIISQQARIIFPHIEPFGVDLDTIAFRTAPPPAPALPPPTATVARTANVRDTPATTGAVLVTLPRDAVVIVLKTNGNWTQVEVPATGGKPQQGWMFNTYLKSTAVRAKPANTSAAVKPAVAAVKPERAPATVEPERASVAVKPENVTTDVKPENTSAAVEPESAAPEPAK